MSSPYYLGIDIGATLIKVGIVTSDGKLVAKEEFETRKLTSPEHFLSMSKEVTDRLLKAKRIEKKSVGGIGVGAPGWVNYSKGIVHELTNIPGWHSVALAAELERETGLKSFVDNDANVMAIGETLFGAGRKYKHLVCLTLGTGVGGAIIIDGKLYRGAGGLAGEVGHVVLDLNGRPCACGATGCLERYVGIKFIVANALKRLEDRPKGKKSLLLRLADNKPENITPELLSKAAENGDEIAIAVWRDTGHFLGIALAVLVNLLNPECFIIGGGVARAGTVLFQPMRETMEALAMNRVGESTPILQAQLGKDAGIIGAATFAMTCVEEQL